jgi:hypothetical protein
VFEAAALLIRPPLFPHPLRPEKRLYFDDFPRRLYTVYSLEILAKFWYYIGSKIIE